MGSGSVYLWTYDGTAMLLREKKNFDFHFLSDDHAVLQYDCLKFDVQYMSTAMPL